MFPLIRTSLCFLSVLRMSRCTVTVPPSPCPAIFTYETDGEKWYGVLKSPNPNQLGSVIRVDIKMSLPIELSSNYIGKIELMEARSTLLQKISLGFPIVFKVNFPLSSPLPHLTRVSFNNWMVCQGPSAVGMTVTSIDLQYTLQTGGRPGAGTSSVQTTPKQSFGDSNDHNSFDNNNNNYEVTTRKNGYSTQTYEDLNGVTKPSFEVDGSNANGNKNYNNLNNQNSNYNDQNNNYNNQNNNFNNQNNNFNNQNNNFNNQQNQYNQNNNYNNINNNYNDNNKNNYNGNSKNNYKPLSDSTDEVTQKINPTAAPSDDYNTTPGLQHSSGGRFQNHESCGTRPGFAVALIVHGKIPERNEWPWLVAVYKRKLGALEFICGSSLVSEKLVVTAAHCIVDGNRRVLKSDNIVLRLGVFNIDDWADSNSVTRAVSDIKTKDYFKTIQFDNDIAVLVMSQEVTFTDYIRPVCLWEGSDDQEQVVGKEGYVVGWGRDEDGVRVTMEPRMVKVPIVSTTTCRGSNPTFFQLTSAKTLCAGSKEGTGPCTGDSGGGLYIQRGKKWYIRGIVSNALKGDNNSCNLYEYIVYTDCAKYVSWIAEVQ